MDFVPSLHKNQTKHFILIKKINQQYLFFRERTNIQFWCLIVINLCLMQNGLLIITDNTGMDHQIDHLITCKFPIGNSFISY